MSEPMNFDIDSPIVDKGVEALFGHHPERGGSERRQAVFAVLTACLDDAEEQLRRAHVAAQEDAETIGSLKMEVQTLRAAAEPQPGEMHEIDQAFYKLTVQERDYERTRYDNLERLVREIGERHGFHWEPDCSPRSMLAKLSNRIELLERDKRRAEYTEPHEQGYRGDPGPMMPPMPTAKIGIATKASADGRIPVGWAADFDLLTKAGCEPVETVGGVIHKGQYPELEAVIGKTYGDLGDELFQLPDLRGRVIE